MPTYDLALAKKLLSESAYPHGFTLPMEVASGDTVSNEIAVLLQSELAPLGIKVTIKQMDPTTFFNAQESGKFHLAANLWTNDIPDPDELVSFGVDYASGSNSWYTGYNSPRITRLSHQAEQSNDPSTRQRLYARIQEIEAADSPFFTLYYAPFVNAVSTHVHGFSENPLGYFELQGVTKS